MCLAHSDVRSGALTYRRLVLYTAQYVCKSASLSSISLDSTYQMYFCTGWYLYFDNHSFKTYIIFGHIFIVNLYPNAFLQWLQYDMQKQSFLPIYTVVISVIVETDYEIRIYCQPALAVLTFYTEYELTISLRSITSSSYVSLHYNLSYHMPQCSPHELFESNFPTNRYIWNLYMIRKLDL